MSKYDLDLIVIGSGPAGEKAAIEASRMRKSTAIIERKSVQGGVCIHTGTIPSKTLRESAMYIAGLRQRTAYGLVGGVKADLSIKDLMHRKDEVVQQELDVIQQNMAVHRIQVIHGAGMITDPHTVVISDSSASARVLTAEVIVISTGTHSFHPPHVPFDNKFVYDAETIIDLDVLPRSLTIVGGGVIGCEYASIFTHLGVKVTIIDPRQKLLSFLDHEIADALSYLMRKYGITLVLGDAVEQIELDDHQTFAVTKTGRRIASDRLLYTAGRCGNTENLGLEAVGIEVDDRGLIKVDETYRTSVPNIYAVGDVIGFPSLASVSMDQGRLAAIHAFKKDDISCLNTCCHSVSIRFRRSRW